MMRAMRAAYALLHLLLFVAAGCSSAQTKHEVRKIETEMRTQPSAQANEDIENAEDDMEPESDPDDR
jgi:hypothetical protein